MLKKTFWIFFVSPLFSLIKILKEYLIFLWNILKDGILIKNFDKRSEQENIEESLKIFRLFLFIIFVNIGVNEIFKIKDSNWITETISEIFITVIFYPLFIGNYYLGRIFNKIYKENLFESISTKLWNLYALIFMGVLQFSQTINTRLDVEMRTNFGIEKITLICIFIFIHLTAFYINRKKKNIFTKKHLFYLFAQYIFTVFGISLLLLCFVAFL